MSHKVLNMSLIIVTVVRLPDRLFEKLENAASAHKPERVVNPSKSWGLDFDIFDD